MVAGAQTRILRLGQAGRRWRPRREPGARSALRRRIRQAPLTLDTRTSPQQVGQPSMAPVVRLLLIVNVIVFALQRISADRFFTHFALWPLGSHLVPEIGWVSFQPWQLVTSAFLHGNFAHIALNMFALYSFGTMVETAVGSRRFATL